MHRTLIAIALCLGACHTASTSTTPPAPTLNTGNSTAGLYLAATAGGSPVTGYVAFTGATGSGIATDGNYDNLSGFTYNPATGLVTLAPPPGEAPGVYPVSLVAGNSGGLVARVSFLAYVYGSSSPGSANADAPVALSLPAASLGADGSASISLGSYNGFTDPASEGISLTPVAGSAAAVNGSISVTGLSATLPPSSSATPEIEPLTASLIVNSRPLAGAGSSNCPNGTLLQLSVPASNGQNPPPYQELLCLSFT